MARFNFRLRGFVPLPPVNTGAPAFPDVPQVGVPSLSSNGSWDNAPVTYSYQHQQSDNGSTGWTDIPGATAQTFTPSEALEGKYLRPGVRATNLGGSSSFAYGAPVGPVAAIGAFSQIWPGDAWNGTEGSGYSGGAVEPTDPARLGPKPIVQARQRPFQVFTSDGDTWIGITAFMGDCVGGLSGVTCNLEGREVTASSMTPRAVPDALNGGAKIRWAYWFKLKKDGFSTYGPFRVNFVATPANPAYQKRVLTQVFHFAAAQFDATYTVNPDLTASGNNFHTIGAAYAAARAAGRTHPLIRLDKTGAIYDFSADPGDNMLTASRYWWTIRAGVGVTATIGRATQGTWRNRCNNLLYEGCVIDFQNMLDSDRSARSDGMYCEDQSEWNMAFVGCQLTDTHADGRYRLVDKAPRPGLIRDPNSATTAYNVYFEDCRLHDVREGFKHGWYDNFQIERTSGDLVSAHKGFYGVVADDNDPRPLRAPIGVFTLNGSATSYTTITAEVTGANDATNRQLIIRGDGSAILTVSLGNTPGSANYVASEVVATINAAGIAGLVCTGITAGGRQDERRMRSLTTADTSGYGATGQKNIKAGAVTFVTAFDIHGDAASASSNGRTDNVLGINFLLTKLYETQVIFLNATGGNRDVALVNWMGATNTDDADNALCHIVQGAKDHILLWNVAIPEQQLVLHSSSATQFSNLEILGCAFDKVTPPSGADTTSNVVGDSNVLFNASLPTPPAWFDPIDIANWSDQFENYTGSPPDFHPKATGALVANAFISPAPFDIEGAATVNPRAVGPYQAAA